MTWRIDPPIRVGAQLFAALSETAITPVPAIDIAAGFGRKRPLLVLCLSADTVTGMDLNGKRYTGPEIETRFPGASEAMRQAGRTHSD